MEELPHLLNLQQLLILWTLGKFSNLWRKLMKDLMDRPVTPLKWRMVMLTRKIVTNPSTNLCQMYHLLPGRLPLPPQVLHRATQ